MQRGVGTAALLALLAWGCGQPAALDPGAARPGAGPGEPRRVSSNLFRGDYAGSAQCRACHPAIYAAWQASPMRNMTRHIDGARVLAPFDGGSYQLKGDRAVFETIGERRFMRIRSAGRGEQLFRLTKVIGGRYREDFAGVDVTGAARPATDRGRGPEQVMPVSFVHGTSSWRYKGYSVLLPERPGLRAGPVWSRTCIGCHNTLPQVAMLYDELLGPGAPGYQGSISDKLLPQERRWRPVVSDPDGLGAELSAEIALLTGRRPRRSERALPDLLRAAIEATRSELDTEHLIEVGIGCEACHGGAREHVADPEVLPSLEPISPLMRVASWDGSRPGRAEAVNRSCARCHTVLFSRYRYTWEGGQRRDPVPGGSSINSGEARDFLLGACSSQLTCTACHDPHGADDRARLEELGTVAGNRVCVGCHPALAEPEALQAHTHHDPAGAGSACASCHMPRKNMGLDYRLTRYHRIGSPNDRDRVLKDRPLECALCHTEASVEELVGSMEAWWGGTFDRAALRRLYGRDLSAGALERTLLSGLPHEQGAAIGALADVGPPAGEGIVALLLPHLAHELPLVRYYAREAIESITGRQVPFELDGAAGDIARAAAAWWTARAEERP
jgi:predicted CXXCH cytochrome family protein